MIVAAHWKMRDYLFEFREGVARLPVLLALVLHANNRLRCWPSTALLCQETGFNKKTVVEARQWLLERKAIQIVPYDKREGDELKLPQRQFVYQLTGMMITKDGPRPYLNMTPEAEDQARPELTEGVAGTPSTPVEEGKGVNDDTFEGVPDESSLGTPKVLKSKDQGSTNEDKDSTDTPTGGPSGGENTSAIIPVPDGKFGYTVGQALFWVQEPNNGPALIHECTVLRFTAKMVWVRNSTGEKCLAPKSLHVHRPELKRKTDALQDVYLECSFGIAPDVPIGKGLMTDANTLKGMLARSWPQVTPELLRSIFAQTVHTPSRPESVVAMIQRHFTNQKGQVYCNGQRPRNVSLAARQPQAAQPGGDRTADAAGVGARAGIPPDVLAARRQRGIEEQERQNALRAQRERERTGL